MRVLRLARDAAILAPCYVALDWASYIDPLGPFNITPWNPQPGLALVWMLLGGLRHVPAVFAAILLGDILVRDVPGGYAITIASALILAVGYAGIALALRRLLEDPGLRRVRDLTLFTSATLVGTAIVGAAFIGLLHSAGLLGTSPIADAWLRFWIGDATGVLVTAPLLIAAADRERRAALAAMARKPEPLLQAAVLAGTVWMIFYSLSGDPARHFYLLFLPLIWIAVRSGMNGAIVATAIVQLGVVLGIHARGLTLSVVELQALVAALTLTSLYLGVMVDERERAELGLRQSLRLAAAGEMAGAIAHEVNQPLTALANYGRSAQMLLDAGAQDRDLLRATIAKILAEADRASDVVRRLRDFFRAGTTRLEPVEVASLVASARRIGEGVIGNAPITIEATAEDRLPALLLDRLQIELVLRNLLANAVDSVLAAGTAQARVEVRAERHDQHSVRIAVRDSGPGVPAALREGLFEPFISGKPTGMGLGLAVSRAIAEAHGGSLEAKGSAHGEFHLVLPCPAS